MIKPPLRVDLREYVWLLWKSRRLLVAGTAASVLLMAALTWAVPRFYRVSLRIDAGTIALLQYPELNLLIEAVDRNQFPADGAMFTEMVPKALTVRFRPPTSIDFEVMTKDPADAVARLPKLADAVVKELNARFTRYQQGRVALYAEIEQAQTDARAKWAALRLMLEVQSVAAGEAFLAARADEARLTASRTALTLAATKGIEHLLADGGDGSTVAREVERAVAQIGDLTNVELSRAAERGQRAQRARERPDRALAMLTPASVTASNEAAARAFEELLGEVGSLYRQEQPEIARAVQETATAFNTLAGGYQAVYGPELSALKGPSLQIPVAMPTQPAWPRPAVNLAIAFLFGLVASLLAAGLRARAELRS